MGEGSLRAAVAIECSGAQGRFWDYYEALFKALEQEGGIAVSVKRLVELADEIGLDLDLLANCSIEQGSLDAIRGDLEAAIDLGKGPVRTPTIFINGTAYEGLRTFDFYRARIDEALAEIDVGQARR